MAGSIVRVFVSSTFNDFQAERDALVDVYRMLDELCRGYGATFQPIDLRWGISPDACRDQETVDICLDELRRCRQLSIRPNFIVLLGDRYGWRPLPSRIDADEFDRICDSISHRYHDVIKAWYTRDDNAPVPEYRLNPISDADEWARAEEGLRSAFRLAMEKLGWQSDDPRLREYEISVTHQEILNGALEVPDSTNDTREHVFCYFRTIEGLPTIAAVGTPARDFADYLPDGSRDLDANDRLGRLRSQLQGYFSNQHTFSYHAHWNGRTAAGDLTELRARIFADLSAVIETRLRDEHQAMPAFEEREAHVRFGESAREGFTGQSQSLADISEYLNESSTGNSANCSPLAIIGPPGSGKTALVAQSAAILQSAGSKVIVRFLGTTPKSSRLDSLLVELCKEIADLSLESESNPIPEDLAELSTEFRRRLMEFPDDFRLILFLDAVDQLEPADGAHSLSWIPQMLPAHVRIVLTVAEEAGPTKSDCVDATRKVAAGRLLKLEGLSGGDPSDLIDTRLSLGDRPRKITSKQRSAILDRFRLHPLPLYLRMLTEEARGWRSTRTIDQLPTDTQGAVEALFTRLERESNHGEVLVRVAISYLVASRRGLSEDDLVQLVSTDPEVMADFLRRSPTEQRKPPTERLKRLPLIVWSRLADELRPYLAERQVSGGRVLNFHHRQITKMAETRYLAGNNRTKTLAALCRYFGDQPDFQGSGRSIPNTRKAEELPFLLKTSGRRDEFVELIGGDSAFSFLEAKVASRMTIELIEDFLNAAEMLPEGDWQRKKFQLLAEAVRRHRALLDLSPDQLLRCLWEECWWYDAPAAADHYPAPKGGWAAEGPPWSLTGPKLSRLIEAWKVAKEQAAPSFRWLRALRPPRIGLGKQESLSLSGHTDLVTNVEFESEGSRAVTGSQDGTVRVWDLITGRERSRFHCPATGVAFTAAGPMALVQTEEGSVEVWDVITATLLFKSAGSDAPVHEAVISPDGRFLAVVAFKIEGYVYLQPGAAKLDFVPATEANEVMENAMFRDGTRKATVVSKGSIKVWHVPTQRPYHQFTLQKHAIEAISFSPDSNLLAFALSGNAIHVEDLRKHKKHAVLRGDVWNVSQLVLTPNGREVLADYADGWAIWTLPANEDSEPTLQLLPEVARRSVVTPEGLICALYLESNECTVVNIITQNVQRFPIPATALGRGPYLAGDGRWLGVGGDDNIVRVWGLTKAAVVAEMNEADESFAFSPDGSLVVGSVGDLAARSDDEASRNILRLSNALTGEMIGDLTDFPGRIELFHFSPDGRYLVAANGEDYLVFDFIESRVIGKVPRPNHSHPPTGIEFHDGILSLKGADNDIRLWKAAQPDVPFLILQGLERSMTVFGFAPVGYWAAAGAIDGIVCVWDIRTGSIVVRFEAHEGRVTALAFSANGKSLVTGGSDCMVKIWNPSTGQQIVVTEGHEQGTMTKRLLPKGAKLSEVYTSTPVSYHQGGTVNSVAFSPDGRLVISGSDDETACVWETISGIKMAQFRIPATDNLTWDDHREIQAVAFLSAEMVAVIDADRYFRAWNWRTNEEMMTYRMLERSRGGIFAPSGDFYAVVAGQEVIIDFPLGEKVESLEFPFRAKRIVIAPDESQLVVAGGTEALVWNCLTKQIVHEFETSQGEVVGVHFANEELIFASIESNPTHIRLDLGTGQNLPFNTRTEALKTPVDPLDGHRRWAGSAVRIWSDTSRICPTTEGTFVDDETEAAPPGGYEARLIDGQWKLVSDRFPPIPLAGHAPEYVAATPDGRTWAVSIPGGWQLYTIEPPKDAISG